MGMGMGIGEPKQNQTKITFENFADYIQENYRVLKNSKDCEILEIIYNNCDLTEITSAITYAKSKNIDSLIYLQKILTNSEYKKQTNPNWFDYEYTSISLEEDDVEFAKEFYKEFCDTKEEYQEKMIKVIACFRQAKKERLC